MQSDDKFKKDQPTNIFQNESLATRPPPPLPLKSTITILHEETLSKPSTPATNNQRLISKWEEGARKLNRNM